MHLLGIGKYVFLPIFSDWILIQELCVLDSAFCHKRDRNLFLKSVVDFEFRGLQPEFVANINYLIWISLRKIHVHSLRLENKVLKQVFQNPQPCGQAFTKTKILQLERISSNKSQNIKSLLLYCDRLENLNLSHSKFVKEIMLSKTAYNLSFLLVLNISHCSALDDYSVCSVIRVSLDLHTIDITACHDLTDDTVTTIADYCHSLTSLNVSECREISNESLSRLVVDCPHLRTLDVRSCNNVTSEVVSLWMKNCASCELITSILLNPANGDVTDHTMKLIAENCTGLTTISVCISEEGVWECKTGGQISRDDYMTSIMRDNAFISVIHANKNALTSINISRSEFLSDKSLEFITHACPNLTHLDISFCEHVKMSCLIGVSGKLTSLNLSGILYYQNSSDIERVITQLGGQLRSLIIDSNDQNIDIALVHIAKYCILLETLSARFVVGNEINFELQQLFIQIGGTLTSLDLSTNYSINDKTMFILCQHCLSLKHLNLLSCPRISGVSIEKIANLTQIETLDLRNVRDIDSNAILNLITACGKTLKNIKLPQSKLLSKSELEALNESLPELYIE